MRCIERNGVRGQEKSARKRDKKREREKSDIAGKRVGRKKRVGVKERK